MEDVGGLADAGAEDVERDKAGYVGEGERDDGKIPVIFGDVCGSLFSVYCEGDESEDESGNGGNIEPWRSGIMINRFRLS